MTLRLSRLYTNCSDWSDIMRDTLYFKMFGVEFHATGSTAILAAALLVDLLIFVGIRNLWMISGP